MVSNFWRWQNVRVIIYCKQMTEYERRRLSTALAGSTFIRSIEPGYTDIIIIQSIYIVFLMMIYYTGQSQSPIFSMVRALVCLFIKLPPSLEDAKWQLHDGRAIVLAIYLRNTTLETNTHDLNTFPHVFR